MLLVSTTPIHISTPNKFLRQRTRRHCFSIKCKCKCKCTFSDGRNKPPPVMFIQLASSAILFLGLAGTARASTETSKADTLIHLRPAAVYEAQQQEHEEEEQEANSANIVENIQDMELKAALESWKSKTFSLTVPLRIVALRGSVPPSWIKEFVSSQGRRLQLKFESRGSLNDILSGLSSSITKANIEAKSVMAADMVTIGDSWLNSAITNGILQPLQDADAQDWFKGLSKKWKVHLCRDVNGQMDPNGKIWAVPYRWGSVVIAYKKNKFRKYNMAPIEDWCDLWRPELAGKIAMFDSPREVVGSILKYMGASYNTTDIDSQVTGGMKAVMQNLVLLQKQVRLFDNVHYLKAFGVGDVWVVVGWSSDILPAVKRMSDVAVIVPKSGASLWADLWAIPAAHRFDTNRIGGRVRGPSPVTQQWIEFCLQAARALPFKQEVVPGASALDLEDTSSGRVDLLTKGRPKLDTNLIGGVPPPEILAKCEFLEPLSESAVNDYKELIVSMQKKPGHHGLKYGVQNYISSVIHRISSKMYI